MAKNTQSIRPALILNRIMQQILHKYSDHDLIYKYQTEDCQQAIRELILRHKDRIYTNIFFIVKDHYLAEDILQETLIKAATQLRQGRYTDQGKFASWIARIAHNLCIDAIRRTKSSHALPTISTEDILPIASPTLESNYSFHLEKNETEQQVWDLVNALPQEQLEVVLMRVYGEMSFREISDAMGVSINTSLGRMRYALINLRKMIKDQQMVLR